MAKNKGKEKGTEFYENPEVLAQQLSKTEQFIENNKKVVLGVGGLIAIIIVAFFGYKYYMDNQNELAQKEMFQAVYWYENGEFDLALNGDGNNLGFMDLLEDFGATKAGNLSSFYIGSIYLQQGEFQKAIDHLEDFSADDLLVQSRAYALIGDAYLELGNYSKAADHYGKAASTNSTEEFSPIYLLKQGLAYEKANDTEKAKDSYKQIIKDFSKSEEVSEAKKYLSLLEAKK
ncbi:tetratricopeptide repeat protein [Marivirga sp. S37H4]|uniref:Tetratricopeptide repeat protein n=1 Tax=Marivirga aurantiaca TaxID=2802615 RepID=A0A934WZ31_9BACT|nr:tetratricopeptide repeat protein [Marivirga aurantiaca]MBK6265532.1 tetratricopeptide repeat protein [Marivirga aurantiaca]